MTTYNILLGQANSMEGETLSWGRESVMAGANL